MIKFDHPLHDEDPYNDGSPDTMTELELEYKYACERLADIKKESEMQAEICWALRKACEENSQGEGR